MILTLVINYHKGVKTRDIIAKFVSVSHKTLEKAEYIVEPAEENPEKYPKR